MKKLLFIWRLSLKHRERLIFSFSKDIVLSLENQIKNLCLNLSREQKPQQ